MDASNLIYTVSENAGALYERYTKSVQKLAADGADAAQQCAAALKKMGLANKERKQQNGNKRDFVTMDETVE